VITVDVERVADSCGYAVPLMGFEAHRAVLDDWSERKGARASATTGRRRTRRASTAPRASLPEHGHRAPAADAGALAVRLAAAGFVAADEEAGELVARAGRDAVLLESMVGRRLTGEPLAWITGTAAFCGMALAVDPGVYVPRWQSEPLARRAVARLPEAGAAIDLCTGTWAVAAVLAASRPSARVVAVDLDARSVACARHNGVEAFMGDLFDPVPLPSKASPTWLSGSSPMCRRTLWASSPATPSSSRPPRL